MTHIWLNFINIKYEKALLFTLTTLVTKCDDTT